MQLWAAARQSVSESSLPPLHKAYLNVRSWFRSLGRLLPPSHLLSAVASRPLGHSPQIFFFGVRMLATNVISFTFYSVLVPMILLVFATEDLEVTVHHRFMPWWAIVWMPLIVTASTMAFSPNSFHCAVAWVSRAVPDSGSDPLPLGLPCLVSRSPESRWIGGRFPQI